MATARIEIDLTFALERGLGAGRGVARGALAAAVERFGSMAAWLDEERAAGRTAWFDLPGDPAPAEAAAAFAAAAPAARDVVVAGIGGSALTARVVEAIAAAPPARPRLHLLDTVDPVAVEGVLERVAPEEALVVAISKSGTTLETTALLLLLEAWLGSAASERLAVVCGEEPNPMRARAAARGQALFAVPRAVGGRWSGLTPVGLLPAALLGVPPLDLLAGACAARARCTGTRLADNPALALACVIHLSCAAGRNVVVVWPYGEALAPLGPWSVQLLGESLGKTGADGPVALLPVAACGPQDQHSLLQRLVGGADDVLTVFVEATGPAGPRVPPGEEPLTPATGRALGDVLAAEREATELALAEAGRPSVTIRLPAADARSVGAFLLVLEAAVHALGRLLGVDPFGQPGVTYGKRVAAAALTGRPHDVVERLEAHRAVPRTRSS